MLVLPSPGIAQITVRRQNDRSRSARLFEKVLSASKWILVIELINCLFNVCSPSVISRLEACGHCFFKQRYNANNDAAMISLDHDCWRQMQSQSFHSR